MKKAVQRLTAVVLICVICFGMMSAYARASDYLQSYGAWCTAGSSGKVSVTVDVAAVRSMDKVGASQIIMQESTDGGSTWTNVKTYVYTSTPAMMASNTVSYFATPVTYSGTVGYRYKAIVTVYAGNSEGSDSKGYLTASVLAKS